MLCEFVVVCLGGVVLLCFVRRTGGFLVFDCAGSVVCLCCVVRGVLGAAVLGRLTCRCGSPSGGCVRWSWGAG